MAVRVSTQVSSWARKARVNITRTRPFVNMDTARGHREKYNYEPSEAKLFANCLNTMLRIPKVRTNASTYHLPSQRDILDVLFSVSASVFKNALFLTIFLFVKTLGHVFMLRCTVGTSCQAH